MFVKGLGQFEAMVSNTNETVMVTRKVTGTFEYVAMLRRDGNVELMTWNMYAICFFGKLISLVNDI